MENPEAAQPEQEPETQEHIPYKTFHVEIPEHRIKATIRWMNKPGPKVYEHLQLWVANFTLRELLGEVETEPGETLSKAS